MTKTPKTLTLSTKAPRAKTAELAVPKTTLSYVIDNAQEAAGKVTVVKKTRSRLAAVAAADNAASDVAELAMPAAAEVDAVADVATEEKAATVKVARKSGPPRPQAERIHAGKR
jgi:RNA polymerase primary sigma factor